jgi:hypothetical protein
MCSVVIGQTLWMLKRSARTRTSCSATRLEWEAMCCTQLTVGLLLLKRATRFSVRGPQTCSIMSHRMTSPASSRSELVITPLLLWSETTFAVMSKCPAATGVKRPMGGMPPVPLRWCRPRRVLMRRLPQQSRAILRQVRSSASGNWWIPVGSSSSLRVLTIGVHFYGDRLLEGIAWGGGCMVTRVPNPQEGRWTRVIALPPLIRIPQMVYHGWPL